MKRATRINLVLLIVVATLGLATYLQVRQEVAQFEPPLSALNPDQIDHVTVSCLQCTVRRFERIDGHWMMREPYDLPADDAQLARLLSIAVSPVRSRRPFTSLDARKIGLDPPLASLDLEGEHFDVGTTDAFNGDRYVRVGDTIAMAPDRFSPFLLATAPSELDRHLLPRGATLTHLRIDSIDRPDLIEAWTAAIASRITAATGNAPTAGALAELQLADGSILEYRFQREGDAAVATRGDPALRYTLSSAQAAALLDVSEPATH